MQHEHHNDEWDKVSHEAELLLKRKQRSESFYKWKRKIGI